MDHRLFFFFIFFIQIFSHYSQNKNSTPNYFISGVSATWSDSSLAKKHFGKKPACNEIRKLIPMHYQQVDSNKFSISLEFTEAKFTEKSSTKSQFQIIDFILSLKLKLWYKTEKGLEELNQLSFESNGQMLASARSTELQKYWKKSIQSLLEKTDAYLIGNADKLILPFHSAIVNVVYNQSQLDNVDSLAFHPNRKLTADDFKGKLDKLSKAGGVTYCGFGLDYDLVVKDFKLYVEIKTACFFHKSKSWLLPSAKMNAEILAHEQLHFEICYWQTLVFRQAILSERYTIDNLKAKIQKCYREQFASYEQLQEQYDEETNHGLIEKEQLRWANLIKEKLSVR